MRNILHVVNISFVIPYFLGEQLLFFRQKGYKEYIVCTSSSELEGLSQKYKFEYKVVDILRKISIRKDLCAVFEVIMYIKKMNIDIVTGHTPKGALIAMLAAFFMKVPVRIYFRHGLVYETSSGIRRRLLIVMDRLAARFATKVVCVSPSICQKSLEDKLNSSFKQILLSKGTCNGIDVERFCKLSINESNLLNLRSELGIKVSDFVIGFSGRLVKDKGIIELVLAFQQLQKKYSDIILLLVGMFEERDTLPDEIVEVIKENTNIINTGYVENATIEFYYALMDIFVLPSYREGFPTSVLEASAMELPVITTRVTGCVDSIIEGETGMFVEHDSCVLATMIEMLYCDEELRYNYGKMGRKFVVNNFEQHVVWKEIEKLYQ